MATTRNTGRIIEPWSGTGWPLSMFVDGNTLLEKGIYVCSRTDCGKKNERILREPWQLNCGHRLCRECFDYIQTLPEDQRLCDACKLEPFDDDARTRKTGEPPTNISLHGDNHKLPGDIPMDIDRLAQFDAMPPKSDATPARSVIANQPSTADEQGHDVKYCKIDNTNAMKDNAANREVNRMVVRCPYSCDITTKLTVRTIEKHMISCKERLVPCDKCAEIIQFSQRSEHSVNTCPFRAIDCPNKCGKKGLKGKDLAKHLAECEKKPPICNICKNPYKYNEDAHDHLLSCVAKCPLNCNESSTEVKIIEHLGKAELLSEHLLALMSLLYEADSVLKAQGSSAGTGMAQTQIASMLERLLQLESKSDKTHRMLADKVSHMTHESASGLLDNARLADKNRADLNDLEVLFKVLAQDVHILTSYDTAFRSLTDKTSKQETETTDRLNKLETLSNIRIAEIEDQKTALNHFQMTSFNGHLIWRIDRVQARRDESTVKHSIYSHPFFTEVYGYKMCARIYFNGDGNGKNTHISLFFVVMKGEYDALLPWPFQQKVTMKLRNQTKKRPDIVEKFRPEPSSSSFQRPKNEMNIASGCPQFAEQSHVFAPENGFVVDNTMFIEISVDNSYEALHGLNISVQEMTRGYSNPGGNK